MSSRNPLRLADMTFEQAHAMLEASAVALLPCGATEAHGPHLPLSTDVIISETAALRAAAVLVAAGQPAAVLPALAYAPAEFAAGFSGTLSLAEDTMRAMVRDVVLSATRAGFRAVVLCNAHLDPGNIGALAGGAKDAREQGANVAFPDVTRRPHALRLGDEFKSGACHAGRYETSLVLAAQPFLVRDDLAEELPENASSLSVAIRAGKSSFEEAGGPQAYFGAPAEATAAEGDLLYDTLADIFATAARELLES